MNTSGDPIPESIDGMRATSASEDRCSPALERIIVGALPFPVFVKDRHHRCVVVNEAAARFLGRHSEEILGKTDRDFLPREEADIFWSVDDRVFATGIPEENEYVVTIVPGDARVVILRQSLRSDDHGRPILLSVVTDITGRKKLEGELRRVQDEVERRVLIRTHELEELSVQLSRDIARRRRAEVRLRDSRERFRTLMDSLPQMVWTSERNGLLFDYINARAREYTGLSLDKTTAKQQWHDAIHPDDVAPVSARWADSISRGVPFEAEYRVRRHDGVYRWHLERAMPVHDESGRLIRWVGSGTDIDDKKRAEQALLEEDQRKDEFLAVLAHELRNPLVPIRNALYLLRRCTPGTPAFDRAVSIVERQVALMARLIDDLLDMSRIAGGEIVLQKERVDLAEVIRTILDDRRENLETKGLTVVADLPPEPIWIDADVARIGQVVTNILENAVRYTDRAGATVVVVARAAEDRAVLSVADQGVGLDATELERIFAPFVQVPIPGRPRVGLGLGLAMVRRLVVLHGGTVEASSAGVGCGSTFTVRFPLANGRATSLREPPAALPAPAPARDRRGPKRILVVEDNTDAAESLRLMLELDGHEVEVVSSGEAGVARARVVRPDVVLSDIGLPGMSGNELARVLRAEAGMRTHLVAITGYGQPQDQEEALRSGFECHITKPFDYGYLAQVLENLEGCGPASPSA